MLLVGFTAKKQGGKNTACDAIIDESLIPTKIFSFADSLKTFCSKHFNIPIDIMYSENGKETYKTDIKWENMGHYIRWKYSDQSNIVGQELVKQARESEIVFWTSMYDSKMWFAGIDDLKKGYMTAREVLQVFGTDFVRRFYGDAWVDGLMNQIGGESVPLSLVSDIRFPNEVDAILDNGGVVVRLTRNPGNDTHLSETALDDYDFTKDRCYVIDNANMGIGMFREEIRKLFLRIYGEKK